MSGLGNMPPRFPHDDIVSVLSIDSVFSTKGDRAVVTRIGDVVAAHRTHNILCDFGVRVSTPPKGRVSLGSVSHVVAVCAFEQVARIYTVADIAGMPSFRHRPSTVSKKKGKSMGEGFLSLKPARCIPICIQNKTVNNAVIRRLGDFVENPLGVGDNLGRHRCSSKASVLGGNALTSVSPF